MMYCRNKIREMEERLSKTENNDSLDQKFHSAITEIRTGYRSRRLSIGSSAR